MNAIAKRRPDRSDDLAVLKQLLLADEQKEIAALREGIDALDARFGTEARFSRALADSLADAARASGPPNHRALAAALAPMVVAGMRRGAADSRDAVVDALAPVTGRLLRRSAAQSLRRGIDSFNERVASFFAGRRAEPESATAPNDAAAFRIEHLLLIDRASAAVAAAWPADPAEATPAAAIAQRLLAAIVDFARNAFTGAEGELRSLDLGGRVVLLRAAPAVVVAAVIRGAKGPGLNAVKQFVDAALKDFLARNPAGLDPGAAEARLQELSRTMTAGNAASGERARWSPAMILGVACLTAAAIGSGLAVKAALDRRALLAELSAIERSGDLLGYPLHLKLESGSRTVLATGLLPNDDALKTVAERVAAAAPGYRFEPRVVTVVGGANSVDRIAGIDSIRQQIDSLGREQRTTSERLADLGAAASDRRVAEQAARSAADAAQKSANAALRMADSAQKSAETAQKTADAAQLTADAAAARALDLATRLDGPAQRLTAFIAGTAVFFGDATAYRDPDETAERLNRLAELMKAADGQVVRIVGHSDGKGAPSVNLHIALRRAERVAADLERRGIDRGRLILLSRRGLVPISDATGPNNVNRRVSFELAFAGE